MCLLPIPLCKLRDDCIQERYDNVTYLELLQQKELMGKGRCLTCSVSDDLKHDEAVHGMAHWCDTTVEFVLVANAIQRLVITQLTESGYSRQCLSFLCS